MGPGVVLDARWRLEAEMNQQFDSPTSSLYKHSVEIVRIPLTMQKLLSVLIWLEIWHSVEKFGIFEEFRPLNASMCPPKTFLYSKAHRLSHREC
jgi:hypothetical protein